MNEVTNPRRTGELAAAKFRKTAAPLLVASAEMTLHQLVDEFLRLTDLVSANRVSSEDEDLEWGGPGELTELGHIASRERQIVQGAVRARFGLSLDSYDR